MYMLDTAAAQRSGQVNFINQKGAYLGKFMRAEVIKSDKGTNGVSFSFEETLGGKCNIDVYTIKADGSKLVGYDLLMAIMTVLKVRETTVQNKNVKKWNQSKKTEESVNAECLVELMNKPIGLILFMEEYLNRDGELRSKPCIYAPFEFDTKLMAREILNKQTEPVLYEKMLFGLKNKTLKTNEAFSSKPITKHSSDPSTLDDSEVPW